MSSTQHPQVLVATTLGISLASIFAGGLCTMSLIEMPTILLPSPRAASADSTKPSKPATPAPHLARQWRDSFTTGKSSGPPLAVGSAACLLYAAYQLTPTLRLQQGLYVAAAVLVTGIVPYTLLVMDETNQELLKRAATGDVMGNQMEEGDVTEVGMPKIGFQGWRTEDLLIRWTRLNLGRASLPLMSVACAITALIW